MSDHESNYKREEDREWRKRVDHELVTLMTATQVLRVQLDDLKKRHHDFEIDLRGEKGRGGLISEYERHDILLTKLNSVIFMDPTGQKGYLADVDFLMGRKHNKEDYEKKKEEFKAAKNQNRWAFATGVVGATVTAIAAIIVGLLSVSPIRSAIEHFLASRFSTQSSSLSSKTNLKRSGRKKSHRRQNPLAVDIQKELPTNDGGVSQPEVPDRRGDDGGLDQ